VIAWEVTVRVNQQQRKQNGVVLIWEGLKRIEKKNTDMKSEE